MVLPMTVVVMWWSLLFLPQATSSLGPFMALGRAAWQEARTTLQRLLRSSEGALRDSAELQRKLLLPQVGLGFIV